MSAFLWYQFSIGAFCFLVRLAMLAKCDYPRLVTHSRAEDACALLLLLAGVLWSGWLLFVSKGGGL